MSSQEQILYVLPQIKKRVIIPKLVILIVLAGVFYLGMALNLALIDIDLQIKTRLQLTGVILIVSCIIIGLLLAVRQSKQNYCFYRDRIIIGKKQIFYKEIDQYAVNKNWLDRLFRTYSLSLNKNFLIQNISSAINIINYVKNLVSYNQNEF